MRGEEHYLWRKEDITGFRRLLESALSAEEYSNLGWNDLENQAEYFYFTADNTVEFVLVPEQEVINADKLISYCLEYGYYSVWELDDSL